ncbi:DMT family transporter [Marimonas arenosa]|uniref:DMT family transporter n=1 Tax=Marimonas arenosa TaxID=1795305 RepID=A0AAE4B285_9RHOB|nr:DMT family transporter [Marimonas arenosa]MDQ2088788.1 DMT family transporter [Marimonas arenosa]
MAPQKTLSPLAWTLLLTLAAIWGGIFPAAKVVLVEVGPVTIVAQRTFWAALILWAIVAWRGQPLPAKPRVWIGFAVMGLINNVLPFSLIFWGQQHIEAGLAAILNGSTAIFGVLVAAIFFADERFTRRKAAGVTLGFLGVATAMGLEHLRQFDLRSLAQLALLGAAMSYALAGVWARKMLHDVPSDVSAAGMLSFAALFAWAGAWTLEGPPSLNYSFITLALLTYIAIPGTAIAFMLYYRVLALAGAANLLLVTLLVAPCAIVISSLSLGESLPFHVLAGFGLIAAGLAVIDGRIVKRLKI